MHSRYMLYKTLNVFLWKSADYYLQYLVFDSLLFESMFINVNTGYLVLQERCLSV